jgi:hypothetical protein
MSFDILVGQEPHQQSFSVHHDLVVQRSARLRDLRVEFVDSPGITLNTDPEVFSAYLHCVYFGADSLKQHIASMEEENGYSKKDFPSDDESANDDNDMVIEPVEKFLIDLYVLADTLLDPISTNLAIDELANLFEKRNRYLDSHLVRYAYESTTEPSPLRKLIRDYSMIDDVSVPMNIGHYKNTKFPCDFISDILFKVLAINRNNPNVRVRKVYHRKSLQSSRYHQVVDKVSADTAKTGVDPKQEEE